MNNEIKEIFNNFKEHLEKNYQSYLSGAVDSTEYYMSCGDLKLLLDYITNLQEENEKLKANLEMYENGVYFSSENDKLQQRIDKAIEYIKNKWKKDKYYHSIENCLEFCEFDKDDLIKILQGTKRR